MNKILTVRLSDEHAEMIKHLKEKRSIKTGSKLILECIEDAYNSYSVLSEDDRDAEIVVAYDKHNKLMNDHANSHQY